MPEAAGGAGAGSLVGVVELALVDRDGGVELSLLRRREAREVAHEEVLAQLGGHLGGIQLQAGTLLVLSPSHDGGSLSPSGRSVQMSGEAKRRCWS